MNFKDFLGKRSLDDNTRLEDALGSYTYTRTKNAPQAATKETLSTIAEVLDIDELELVLRYGIAHNNVSLNDLVKMYANRRSRRWGTNGIEKTMDQMLDTIELTEKMLKLLT
jgi:hypothetical protein